MQLTDLQLAILDILWNGGETTVQSIHRSLAHERDLAVSTVATIVSRLEKKGILIRRSEGRQYFYEAAVTREQVRTSMVGGLTSTLFSGEKKALLAHLVDGGSMTEDELDYLKSLVESAERRTVAPSEGERGE